MSATFTVQDEATRVSPLGVRFWDPVTDALVTDGLALAVDGASPPVTVNVNPSGVFILSGLPGLGSAERGRGDTAYWNPPPQPASYVITVDDTLRRYLPCSFRLLGPTRWVARLECATATAVGAIAPFLGAVPLFASPAQAAPVGMATVSAWLWDAVTDAPAAYASLRVQGGTAPERVGLADAQGRVAVSLPYPPLVTTFASPPGGDSAARALGSETWSVGVTVRYDPAVATTGPPAHPDLCALLAQPVASARAAQSPPSPLTAAQLSYGSELVLATDGEPYLLVEPALAGSPPGS